MAISVVETAMAEDTEGKPRFKWGVIGPEITEAQQEAIDHLPPKMSKRCQALMKQIICFSAEKGSLCEVLDAWVNIMKPSRADWLAVLKELKIKDHPLYLQVFFFFSFLSLLDICFLSTSLLGLLCLKCLLEVSLSFDFVVCLVLFVDMNS